MFSPKQSDIFYNDETKEMFVCKVSAISADRCDGTSELVYGAVPLVYKIDKNTNYKSRVYPRDIDSFSLSANSDLFSLTPNCPEGTNFNSITKPLINYNKSTSRYSVTFLGRYSTDTEGLGLNNYIFQDIDSYFYLLDANIYIPKAKFTDDQFTFESGHLNSDLYVVGNTVRNDKPSWFNPANVEVERSTDYQIAPMHVQATSSLGFNLALGNTNVEIDSVSGNVAFPFMYSGGFITYNPKYVAYDPEYTIRVDFRARSFTVPSPTAYGSSQSVGASATRWVQQWATPSPGEGFCVSFFKNPPKNSYVIPNGVGSTLGYAKAGFSPNEVAGTAQATDGLYIHNNWSPNTGTTIKPMYTGNVGNVGNIGSFGLAESFLGIGFDIGGNFATTSEEKTGAYADNKTFTAKTCSIGIRGSSYHETKALTSFKMDTVAASAVPMHTSAANADFVDYRIDLSNKGTKVTLYNKLTSATDYNTITELRLNKIGGGNIGEYSPWEGLRSADQIKDKEWPLLNVGLSFTTSDKASRFELHKFEVTGVKVTNPWEVKLEKKTEAAKRIDYLQESSKNLRKKLLNVESDDLVDVEMVVPAKNIIANAINEETNKPQISLCDGSDPEVIEDDVDIKITGIRPEQVDKAIEVGASGYLPKIPGGVTTIKHVGKDINTDTVITAEAEPIVAEAEPIDIHVPKKQCEVKTNFIMREIIRNMNVWAGSMTTAGVFITQITKVELVRTIQLYPESEIYTMYDQTPDGGWSDGQFGVSLKSWFGNLNYTNAIVPVVMKEFPMYDAGGKPVIINIPGIRITTQTTWGPHKGRGGAEAKREITDDACYVILAEGILGDGIGTVEVQYDWLVDTGMKKLQNEINRNETLNSASIDFIVDSN